MTEVLHGPTGPGTVVLDIGPGIGALILHTPRELAGHEIEISPAGGPCVQRTHAQVRERPVDVGTGYAAIYPGLPAGRYTIWRDKMTAAGSVMVTGGKVARFDWA
ncbi:MAG TPA: hypothetical protein VGG35_08825 [Streptosporangiaceae bacterium]|jgi:hypothetical protein